MPTTTATSADAPPPTAPTYPNNVGDRDPRITLELRATSTSLRQGETAQISLTVRNQSGEAVTLRFSQAGDGLRSDDVNNQCRAPYGLFSNGAKVGGSDSYSCADAIGQATLSPGESATYQAVLDTRSVREGRNGVREELLAPGTYDLFMGFDAGTDGHRPTWYADPMTVNVHSA